MDKDKSVICRIGIGIIVSGAIAALAIVLPELIARRMFYYKHNEREK